MIFMGFDDGAKCIRYYDKATRRVKRSRNYKFNENEEPQLEITEKESPSCTIKPILPSEPPDDITRSTESSCAKNVDPEQTHMATENIFESIFRDATFFSAREEELMENPITVEDALNGEEADQWKKAIDEELGTLKRMGT